MDGKAVRQSESFWRGHVAAWRGSGLSRGDYCAEHGLSRRTFGWWVWHLGREDRRSADDGQPRFLAIEPVDADHVAYGDGDAEPAVPRATADVAFQIEIVLPDGIAVRVGRTVDEAALGRVLRVLGR